MNYEKFRTTATPMGSTRSKTCSKFLIAALCLAAPLAISAQTPSSISDTAQSQARVATRTELRVSTSKNGSSTEGVFTVKVLDATGEPVTDGSVSILSGSQSLGSALVSADGTATVNVSNLPDGNQKITAAYDGGSSHTASQSSFSQVSPDASGAPTFTITANPTSATVTAGQYASYVVTVTPQNGFNESITLTCGANPPSTTCTFSPTSVVFAAPPAGSTTPAPVSSTLQIQTLAPSGKSLSGSLVPTGGNGTMLAILLPGGLLLAGLGLLRRKDTAALRYFGFVLLFAASCTGLTACNQRWGYLHQGPFPNTGTPTGNYSFSLTGYGNNGSAVTTQTIGLTLIVK